MLPKMEPPRASTIELSPFSSRAADLARRIKESKRSELIRTEAFASSQKLLSPRCVVCGHVAIMFGMGRRVMKGITCCNTVSEAPTTRGVASDEKRRLNTPRVLIIRQYDNRHCVRTRAPRPPPSYTVAVYPPPESTPPPPTALLIIHFK